jgi:ABC-2 type transport system permease protein
MIAYILARLRMILHKAWPLTPVRALFWAGFGLFGLLFGAGDFIFFHRIFENLLATEGIPHALLVAVAAKLMGLVLLTTFTLLIFSAAVSALSHLYLDEDLHLLHVLPLGSLRILAARSAQAATSAGAMVALLLAPVVAAYTFVGQFRFVPLLAGLAGLVLYLAAPLSWGISFTVLMARFFPARRLHQVLTVLTVVMVCLLVVLFRLSNPEILLNPDSGTQLLAALRAVDLPSERALPSAWLAKAVVQASEGRWGLAVPNLLRLAVLAAASLGALGLLLRRFYWRGFGRAQEMGGGTGEEGAGAIPFLSAAVTVMAPAGRRSRAILRRDVLLFLRDPTQWGQLFILSALVVIYLYNVKQMPSGTAVFRVAVSFWNLATLGLIVGAVAGRFAFSAVGSEGQAYFMSRTLPIPVPSYLWAKFLFTAVPLSAMAVVVLYGSNRFLGVAGEALVYSVFLGLCASVSLSVMALALGCAAPMFNARNPAMAVMSAPGLVYMFLSTLYVGAMIALSAGPVYRYYATLLVEGSAPGYGAAALHVGALSALVVLAGSIFAVRRLRGLEPG